MLIYAILNDGTRHCLFRAPADFNLHEWQNRPERLAAMRLLGIRCYTFEMLPPCPHCGK